MAPQPQIVSQAQRDQLVKTLDEQHAYILDQLDQKQYTGSRIKNVWVYNFEQELDKISRLLDDYPYIAFVSDK